jgi:hypothetical protein
MATYSNVKEIQKICKAVERLGIRIEKAGSGHIKIYPPTGPIIVVASSPKHPKIYKQIIMQLRKGGIPV